MCTPPIVVIRESGLTIIELELELEQGRRIGGMSQRAACEWSHVHVDSGPVALCGPVALYLLQ